jgi:hypothetical protein
MEWELRVAPGPQPFEGRAPAAEATWITTRFHRVLVLLARSRCRQTHASRDLRHIPWAAIERRSDGRARCQQQYGQIRFEQMDVGLDDRDCIPRSVQTSAPAVERAVVWR